ncbi:MAG: enoyl-CoA hydratase/isomerase family protein, partial [Bosea sp.]|uniref:enoyl-CoA hydratase/isomerase family protein n=1 Tax=Bosea sp. (in: a-proteobacteria) TaxID=1871050 RepID=UPI00239A5E5E|nr:enoyl-CoA hydratase/isomerase family protein [Bosea sp. (in: a-proteobacteria)]
RIARRQGGKDCGKVGLPEITLGVLPGTGGTQRLARMLGKSRAIELMVTGGLLNLEQGKDLGLINDFFDADGLDSWRARIHEYAQQFCPPNTASKAAGRIKRAVQSGWEVPFESGLAIERELQQQLFESDDQLSDIVQAIGAHAALLERRPGHDGSVASLKSIIADRDEREQAFP